MEFHWYDSLTVFMFFIFLYGILYSDGTLFIKLNFIIKVFISLYLIYHFNHFTNDPIKFTTLDKRICYSAGVYLFIFSFADVLDNYFKQINEIIMNFINIKMYNTM
jgi:hypothetical protein